MFFKVRAFFETYSKSHIANKLEKTFVDYFLLEDEKKVLDFANPHNLLKINALEKTLLVIYLQEISKNEVHK
jgi:hypothetical protein